MKTILSEKLPRILKNKKNLEKELNVKISNRGKEVHIQGKPEDEYTAEKVIDAINFGFPYSHALAIKQGYILERINIKDYSKRQDLGRIRARIIGKRGKALQTLSNLTESHIELKDNHVGIIAGPESAQNVQTAVISIIKGSKHSNVYKYLERNKMKKVSDLGLKSL